MVLFGSDGLPRFGALTPPLLLFTVNTGWLPTPNTTRPELIRVVELSLANVTGAGDTSPMSHLAADFVGCGRRRFAAPPLRPPATSPVRGASARRSAA